jgi:hypothetical protein
MSEVHAIEGADAANGAAIAWQNRREAIVDVHQ